LPIPPLSSFFGAKLARLTVRSADLSSSLEREEKADVGGEIEHAGNDMQSRNAAIKRDINSSPPTGETTGSAALNKSIPSWVTNTLLR